MKESKLTLGKLDISKSISARLKAVAAADGGTVRDLYSYPANRLANALHPHAQFLTVAEVIEHFAKKDIKGEIVIVLEGALGADNFQADDDADEN